MDGDLSIPIKENVKAFINALQPNMMSILIFDRASQVVGFAVFNRNDERCLAKIYNIDCDEIKEVLLTTPIKEMVDLLLKDTCTYIT